MVLWHKLKLQSILTPLDFYTVDLVIFACLNFRKFLIPGPFMHFSSAIIIIIFVLEFAVILAKSANKPANIQIYNNDLCLRDRNFRN